MSSTNTTPNFGLPQYIPTDKPTYLGDFNKAMLDIDTNMKSIENKATSAESGIETVQATANQALENANTAQTTATQAQTTADLAKTKADTATKTATGAQTTATQAKQTATQAKQTADTANTNINNLNASIANWINQDIKNPDNTASSVKMSFNKTLKLMQIYGYVDVINTTQIKIATIPTNLVRALQNITIQGGCFYASTGGDYKPVVMEVNKSNEIYVPNSANYENMTQLRFNLTINLSDTTRWNIL